MNKRILSVLLALAFSPVFAADYYIVTPVKGRTVSTSAIDVALQPATLPAAYVGNSYAYDFKPNLQVTGDAGYTGFGVRWAVVGGSLPAGLVLDAATGVLAGSPSAVATSTFQVQATYKTKTGIQTYQQTVSVAVTVGLSGGTPPQGIVGQAYSYNLKPLVSVGGDATYNGSGLTWSVVSSTLPAGLSLATDGTISGTPSAAGTGSLTARASYKGATGDGSYTMTVVVPVLTGAFTADDGTDFGGVVLKNLMLASARRFTFQNTGNLPLAGVYATASGTYLNLAANATTCGTQAAPITLAAGGTCFVSAYYAPESVSTLTGSVAVVTENATNGPFQLAVTGSAYTEDANFASVKFLSGFEGTAGSSTMPADVGSLTAAGASAALASSPTKFGATSACFNGSGNYAYTPVNAAYDLASTDFTLEAWVYPQASTGALLAIGNGAAYGNSLYVQRGTNSFSFGMASSSNSNAFSASTAASYPTGQWYHLAVTRSSGTARLFVNGSLAASGTYAGPGKTSNRIILNGLNDNNGLGSSASIACFDEVRFTAGTVRYSSGGFVAPTVAFPRR